MTFEAKGYFVWNPAQNRPEMQQKTVDSAIKEAERLAARNPGQQFIVLKALGQAVMQMPGQFQPADDFDYAYDRELPF